MSRLVKSFVLFVSLIGLGMWGGNAQAAIITSTAAGGTWTVAGTWVGGVVPATGDTVIIAGPGLVTITVTVTQTALGSVTVNSGASLSTTGGTTTFGALTIANTGTAGTYTTSRVLRVLGATNITGTINLSGARLNIFTGDVTLNGGAVWNNTTTSVQTFSGNFTNNATTFTATGTGGYTFNGVGKTLSGATAIVHPTVTFSGVGASYTNTGTLTAATLLTVTSPAVLTNNGTITATTALSGTGGVTQGATGVLNIGAASAITTLTAIAAGNVVNYTGGAAQTINPTTYATLNFSGAGVKTNSGIVTVNAALTGTAMTNAATGTLNIGGTSTITTLTATAAGNIVNYTGAAQTIKATAYDTLNVTGTATNSGTVTAATALGGVGTLTNDATGILNIGGTSLITTLTAATVGNIVNYTGAGAQTINPTTYATLNFSGAGVKTNSGIVTVNTALTGTAMTNAATGTLNIGGTSTITTLTATAAGNIVNYTGAAQTIKATAYDTLNVTGTATNSGTVTAATALGGVGTLTNDATGILNIGGTSLITTLTATTVGNIVNYTGAGAQTINPTTYATLNFSGAGVKTNSGIVTVNTALTGTAMTNAATGTLNIGGTSTITTLTATAAGNIVNYTGAGQTVKATTYHHLGLGGSGAKAMGATAINGDFTLSGSATTAPSGALTVGGNFTIGAGTTFTAGALAHSVGGNWNNSGMFTAGTSTITLNGAVPQTIGGTSNTTFNNLTVNNANGVILNSSPTVSGTLALTAGVVTAGSYTLRSSANCTTGVTVGTGYVSGSVELTFPPGNVTCRFPVGSGSVYAPIDLTTPAGSGGGTMTGSTTGNEHPNVASSSIDSSKDANRFWTLSGDNINASPYVTTFNFVTGDVDIGASPGGFVLGRYASSAWTAPTPLTPFALSITATSLTGPIVGTTDFVAGEAGFVCSIPTGSPDGTTCVCDNFNRVTLNPSTMFPGASWAVSTNSGTFGLPRIVNNKLRLTDNTGNVATAATAPGTYPAKGNWISVEFKHYAYNGTGADGIAFTLSDALITAAPGAFGGSLGYAPKTLAGTGSPVVSGGADIPGFAGGWVGIGIDEYGNFSTETEGRIGGRVPGNNALTVDSVSVRGSGSAITGYPYLGGTATLVPPIDAPAPATAGLGHAYRLTVDARCYQNNTANSPAPAPNDCATINPTGIRSTLVSVDRDTTGIGTSYTPLVPAFDAYGVNASQADVPTDWQLSFTGSTGGSTNFHEIIGLKICAQTIVPPAGYRIQVDNMAPTTCPSDPQPTVTISPLNANGQVITNYTSTVTLAATLASGGGGGASSATWIPYPSNLGTWDGVNKRYTFVAGDNGVAKFYLSDLVQQNVYITVSEYLGTLNSSLAAPVYFSSGAASFVVDSPVVGHAHPSFALAPFEALGTGVVAGRPHLMRISRNTVGCGGGTDVGFIGAKSLDGWYNPATGDHPSGALAPQICAPVSGACLPSYGSCQTLSIAAPVVDSGSNNLSLTFATGVADFCLVTSDVGKYSVGLRDDSVATGTPAVTGTSTTLTARPFAVVVSGMTGNPGGTDYNGTVFTSAGTQFPATVGGYLWNTSADTGANGLPGNVDFATMTAAGLAPHYADTVTLAAGAPYTPVPAVGPPAFVAGALSNGGVSVMTGGTATVSTLSYDEVGSFTLTATPALDYLTGGGDLGPRVAIFSIPSSSSQNKWVGRFKPHHFDTSVVLSSGVPMPCPTGPPILTCPASNDLQDGFVYSGQPFSVQVIAKNAGGNTTQNYQGVFAKDVTLAAWDALGSTATQNPSGALANSAITAALFSAGAATTTAPTYTLAAVTTAPTDIYLRAVDTDSVTSLRATPSSSVEGGVKVVSGRIKIGNAYGSELLPLPMTATVQYYNGTYWTTSVTDDVTSFDTTLSTSGGNLVATIISGLGGGITVSNPGTNPVVDGVRTFRFAAPGVRGSANISLNAPAYLPSNTARATFGVYRGSNEFIYIRENY